MHGRGTVVGFATVAASSIERASEPSARLGLGHALLRHVLALAVEQRDRIGCVGVATDAKPEAVSFYQAAGFVPVEGVREGLLHGEPLAMFLTIETIASALVRRAVGRLTRVPVPRRITAARSAARGRRAGHGR